MDTELLTLILNQYINSLPDWALATLLIVGSLRLIFKPLMTIVTTIVDQTPSKSDDEWLQKAMGSKTYKTICFIFDLVASIKLPKKEDK